MKKIRQFSETHISKSSYLADFFKFVVPGRVYGGHKIDKFDRNWSSTYRDMRC